MRSVIPELRTPQKGAQYLFWGISAAKPERDGC